MNPLEPTQTCCMTGKPVEFKSRFCMCFVDKARTEFMRFLDCAKLFVSINYYSAKKTITIQTTFFSSCVFDPVLALYNDFLVFNATECLWLVQSYKVFSYVCAELFSQEKICVHF